MKPVFLLNKFSAIRVISVRRFGASALAAGGLKGSKRRERSLAFFANVLSVLWTVVKRVASPSLSPRATKKSGDKLVRFRERCLI